MATERVQSSRPTLDPPLTVSLRAGRGDPEVDADSPGWARIALYGLPAAGVAFMQNLIAMFLLKFTTDVLLLAPALVAFFFGLSRVWDAISDPLVGYWSDRTQTRLGRRRPWILASALPLAPGADSGRARRDLPRRRLRAVSAIDRCRAGSCVVHSEP